MRSFGFHSEKTKTKKKVWNNMMASKWQKHLFSGELPFSARYTLSASENWSWNCSFVKIADKWPKSVLLSDNRILFIIKAEISADTSQKSKRYLVCSMNCVLTGNYISEQQFSPSYSPFFFVENLFAKIHHKLFSCTILTWRNLVSHVILCSILSILACKVCRTQRVVHDSSFWNVVQYVTPFRQSIV